MNKYRYCDHKQCSTISAFCDITLIVLMKIIDSRKVVTLKTLAFIMTESTNNDFGGVNQLFK